MSTKKKTGISDERMTELLLMYETSKVACRPIDTDFDSVHDEMWSKISDFAGESGVSEKEATILIKSLTEDAFRQMMDSK